MQITPIGERVLIAPNETTDKTKGGIYIPDEAKEKKKEGIVAAIGTANNGSPLAIEVGDKIIYGGYSADTVTVDNKEYVVVEYKDIIAKYTD